MLAPTPVSEEQKKVTEEPEALPALSTADEPPFISQSDEILLPEPKETPHPTDTSEHEAPSPETEIGYPRPCSASTAAATKSFLFGQYS
ncbi:MAG: hypothetical protein O3A82_07945 [Verrucomicrobia bacterium]|nr:hypothetical protein [Verrucomicrobiota bacterium]MDA1046844.1 hypothetical protein [Verrucomicrobiota bacterium]